jgi:hypothetical protein
MRLILGGIVLKLSLALEGCLRHVEVQIKPPALAWNPCEWDEDEQLQELAQVAVGRKMGLLAIQMIQRSHYPLWSVSAAYVKRFFGTRTLGLRACQEQSPDPHQTASCNPN